MYGTKQNGACETVPEVDKKYCYTGNLD